MKSLCFSKSALGNSACGWKIMYSSVNCFVVLDTKKVRLTFRFKKVSKNSMTNTPQSYPFSCCGTCGTKHFYWCHFEWKDSYLKPSSSFAFCLTIVTKKSLPLLVQQRSLQFKKAHLKFVHEQFLLSMHNEELEKYLRDRGVLITGLTSYLGVV